MSDDIIISIYERVYHAECLCK